MTTHHMAFKRFLSVLTETIQNTEYHDLIVHRLAGHPFIWKKKKNIKNKNKFYLHFALE